MTAFTISAPELIGLASPFEFFATSGRFLALPFDAMRAQYAVAVNAGLVERSMIASGRFERRLAKLERFVLGPFARRV